VAVSQRSSRICGGERPERIFYTSLSQYKHISVHNFRQEQVTSKNLLFSEMKFLIVLATLAAAVLSTLAFEVEEGVLVFTDDNFEEGIKQHSHVLVEVLYIIIYASDLFSTLCILIVNSVHLILQFYAPCK
jgi:thermostable 8-oxoguanine DNA glycosylase